MALTDLAIEKIKEMIQSGELAPGDRLPPEQELSRRLGLSRSSLREAVKALEAIQILDVRRGDGTFVTSLEPELLLGTVSFILDFHRSNAVLEVFEVRRLLESEAAALSALRATPEDIAAISTTFNLAKAGDIDSLIEHDKEFHASIAASSGNGYLAGLISSVSDQTVRARYWRGVVEESASARTLAEHRSILTAIQDRNPDLARALTLTHIAGVEDWLKANAG